MIKDQKIKDIQPIPFLSRRALSTNFQILNIGIDEIVFRVSSCYEGKEFQERSKYESVGR